MLLASNDQTPYLVNRSPAHRARLGRRGIPVVPSGVTGLELPGAHINQVITEAVSRLLFQWLTRAFHPACSGAVCSECYRASIAGPRLPRLARHAKSPSCKGWVMTHLLSGEIASARPSPMRAGGEPSVSRRNTV